MPAAKVPHPLFGLVGAQALGMFNDNLLKMMVVLLLVRSSHDEASQQTATFWGFLAYTAPYVLLSMPAGVIADGYSKRRVLLTIKVLEALIVLQAGLALMEGSPPAVLGVLTAMGILSALSSPTKYGLLPELLPEERLAYGNGVFVLASWIATILGTGLAGVVLDHLGQGRMWQLGVGLCALSVGGLLLARRIPPPLTSARPPGRSLRATARVGWRSILGSRSLRMAVVGSTCFWTLGALLQQDVIVYSKSELHLPDTGKSLLQAALAVGIGVGSLLVGQLTRGRLGVRWVHRGAAAMGALLLIVGWGPAHTVLATVLLFLVGLSSGLIVVPLNALAQGRSSPDQRGAVIAVLNVFVFSGVILGSLAGAALGRWGLSSGTIFVVGGAAALGGALWARRARSRLDLPLPARLEA